MLSSPWRQWMNRSTGKASANRRRRLARKAAAPLVIRAGTGGWLSAAAQHSQSLEAWFTHIPGIKVATSGTPSDARSILRAAIDDENPVLVIESLSLYEGQDDVPDDPPAFLPMWNGVLVGPNR